ncbi:endonuclease domain-containing protein [Maricaulis maris]|uniref:endonuclease domain-containing protein n=1 Tax=Maricaulis maris TaxID=74318 RepID=UPI0026EA579B|nr:endonuclease domain-containing protein [Maricaulis maris]
MNDRLRSFARRMRTAQTPAEARLWSRLRNRKLTGAKFRRQIPIGPYIVDFVCFEARLIIEADGGQHADLEPEDAERTAWLEAQGFTVLRFWNRHILKRTDAVMEVIGETLHWATHPDKDSQPG